MLIARLIEILSEFPQDLEVRIETSDGPVTVGEVYEDEAFGCVFITTEDE
jgi:hypothetical protein